MRLDGLRLGLYTRYSLVIGGDDALVRQNDDGYDFAVEFGGTVAKVYQERRSAWRRKRIVQPDGRIIMRVIRPAFQQMLDDLRNRRIDGAVVYDLDRLTRDLRDLEDAIEVAEVYGCPIVGPGVDLTTDYGRNAARGQAVGANKASSDTSRREKRAHRQWQEQGLSRATVRPFGWEDDRLTVREVEAEAIRKAVADVTNRVPVSDIVMRWSEAGFTGSRGAAIRLTMVQQILRNPRLCGWRARTVHTPNPDGTINTHKELVTKKETQADGTVREVQVIGNWQPIVTPEEWTKMIAVLGDRRVRERGKNARVHLLSGIARCSLCGSGLRCGNGLYQCKPKTQGGCGGLGRNETRVDDHVLSALFHKVETELRAADASTTVEAPRWGRQAEWDEVQESLAALRDAWMSTPRRISPKSYFRDLELLEAREQEMEEERTRFLAETPGGAKTRPADIRAEWDDYTLARQRQIISEHLHAVVIYPVGRGRQTFDPTKIELVWRT